ncbi:hypothetical protein [Erythrobacter sp. JK5]|uniref:hypothetical protein n=1 Tax=Erythrobacter sp. JK5 TaxID=2829500 RepID=UPI001BA5119C|nr:hypothetical protein [Erythrobacter sp. JK5]QUL37095.1 hypothetical protein KDC96_11950 [Erythrobacter sp. JK5]
MFRPTDPMAFRSIAALGLFCALLAACDGGSSGSGPGGVSEGEARALDEAAEMLDARQLPDGALPTVATPPANAPDESGETAEVTGDGEG